MTIATIEIPFRLNVEDASADEAAAALRTLALAGLDLTNPGESYYAAACRLLGAAAAAGNYHVPTKAQREAEDETLAARLG